MKMTTQEDRLIHVLLRATLGDDAPPDMTERVLDRAFARPVRRWRRVAWIAAAAAVVVAVFTVAHMMMAGAYPAPAASGEFTVAGGGSVERGSILTTNDKAAQVVLGGYCHVDMEPGSKLRIAGEPKNERVVLESGGLTCSVNRDRGGFIVETEQGTVSVTGTEFVVRLLDEKGEDGVIGKRMFVKVLVGTVILTTALGNVELAAGADTTTAAGKIFAGKPRYRAKTHEAWAEKGRLVGPIRAGAPACKIELLDKDGKVVASTERPKDAKGYETVFLAPGVYTLRVSATGYTTLEVKELVIKAKNDVSVVLEFTAPAQD